LVATNISALRLTELQKPGGRRLTSASAVRLFENFLRGNLLAP